MRGRGLLNIRSFKDKQIKLNIEKVVGIIFWETVKYLYCILDFEKSCTVYKYAAHNIHFITDYPH